MKPNRLVLLAGICTAFFISCKHTDKPGVLVPKDAALVFHIDGASLASKLPWEDIKATTWYKKVSGETTDTLAKKLLEDPRHSGIEIRASLTIFLKKQGQGSYIGIDGTISDAAAFEAFNKKISKEAGAVTKDGDISQQQLADGAYVSWNSNYFTYTISMPGFSGASAFLRSSHPEPYTLPADSLKKFGKETLHLSGDASLTSDSRFTDMLSETGDCHFWFNSGEYTGDILSGAMSMMKLDVLLKDNISATTLNFDNGKITFKAKRYFNKEMSDFINKYPPHAVSADVYNRIASKDVDLVCSFNYPPDGIVAFMKLIGVDGLINGGLGKYNFSLDELLKATKGDFVLAATDFKVERKEINLPGGAEPIKTTSPNIKLLFATTVNDKPTFDKIISTVKTETAPFADKMPPVTYAINNGWFAIGNSDDGVNKFLAGGNNNQPFASKLGGHAFGFYMDVQKIFNGVGTLTDDNNSNGSQSAKAIIDASKGIWKDFYAWGDYKSGSQAEINLVDPNTNSLKQLNQYFDKLAAAAIKMGVGTDVTPDASAMPADSAAAALPPPPPPPHSGN